MSDKAWKANERRTCRLLGGERRGPGGGSDDDGSLWVAVEHKRTTRYQLRSRWVAQARRQGKATGRPWVLVLHEHNDPRGLAVLDFLAYVQLCEEAGRIPGSESQKLVGEGSLLARLQACEEALREDPSKWSFDTLVFIAQSLLEENYPAVVFDGSSGEPGPVFVARLREALAALDTDEKPQRFTKRGAECRETHRKGYTGPICSCPPLDCQADTDEKP